jgi:hypothetical protein
LPPALAGGQEETNRMALAELQKTFLTALAKATKKKKFNLLFG